jgi:DNA-binding transcriptional MocR family regulator
MVSDPGPACGMLLTPAHQFPLGAVLGPQRRTQVVARAAGHGLAVEGLTEFHAAGQPSRPALVVGYGTPPDHAFTSALARLCAVLGN